MQNKNAYTLVVICKRRKVVRANLSRNRKSVFNSWDFFIRANDCKTSLKIYRPYSLTDMSPESTPHSFPSRISVTRFTVSILLPVFSVLVSSQAFCHVLPMCIPLDVLRARSHVFLVRLVVSFLVCLFPSAIVRSLAHSWLTLHTSFLLAFRDWGKGVGRTPIKVYGEAPPERVLLSDLGIERIGLSHIPSWGKWQGRKICHLVISNGKQKDKGWHLGAEPPLKELCRAPSKGGGAGGRGGKGGKGHALSSKFARSLQNLLPRS